MTGSNTSVNHKQFLISKTFTNVYFHTMFTMYFKIYLNIASLLGSIITRYLNVDVWRPHNGFYKNRFQIQFYNNLTDLIYNYAIFQSILILINDNK